MTLCLIAGRGCLPYLLAEAFPGAHLAALEGFVPDGLAVAETFRIERLGSFLAALKDRGIERVCFAGAVARPAVDPARIDAATLPLVPRILGALGQGDDAALRAVLTVFEEAGLEPIAAHDLLPDLLPPPGILGTIEPDLPTRNDATRAEAVLRAMGGADVGQGCIVAQGQVLAMEAMPGTDWMLAALAAMRAGGPLSRDLPKGGLLMKAPKADQDRRIDLPAIGVETVDAAAKAGLKGIVAAAGGVMVLDGEAVAARADAAGLFVWVRE